MRIPDHPVGDHASQQASPDKAAHGRQQRTSRPMRPTLSPQIRLIVLSWWAPGSILRLQTRRVCEGQGEAGVAWSDAPRRAGR